MAEQKLHASPAQHEMLTTRIWHGIQIILSIPVVLWYMRVYGHTVRFFPSGGTKS